MTRSRAGGAHRFLTSAGALLVGVGVLGTLLPLFGLQLRRLGELPLGAWAGVPFIVIGAVMIGLGFVGRRSPRLLKHAAIGAVVAVVGFIALAIAGPLLLGERARPSAAQRKLDELVEAGEVGPARSAARPAPRQDRPRPGDVRGRQDPRSDPSQYGDVWTITIGRRLGPEEHERIKQALLGIVPHEGHALQVRYRDGITTVTIAPVADAAMLRAAMEGLGALTLDEGAMRGEFRPNR